MNEILDILLNPLMLPIVIALAAGALAYALSRWSPFVCRLLALVSCTCVLVALIAAAAGPQASFRATWVRLAPELAFRVELAPTTLGMLVAIGTAAFAILITVYSFAAMAGQYWEGKFYAYLVWALAGACIVGLAENLLVLLVGWELVTLMLFLMINMGSRDAKAGAAKAYGMLGFADACLLLAVAMLVAMPGGTGNLSLSSAARSVGEMGAGGYLIYLLILVAALAKAGAVPLHTWIPAAAADAPAPVMAYLPAATDKLMGIYLVAVLTLRMFRPDYAMQLVMMTVGAVTILSAVLMAMMQHNLKRLLSFHAVSQVGYMVLGIGTGTTIGVIGGLFHMLNHSIYKSNLFLMSGTVGRAAGTDELKDMGGLARHLPITFVSGLIAAAAISGVPPFNGFVSKWLVYQATLELPNHGLGLALMVVAVFGSALTLASFVKVMYSAFVSPAPAGAAPRPRPRESFLTAAPMVVLAAACVLLGLFPSVAINGIFEPAVAEATTTGQAVVADVEGVSTGPIGLWNPTQATGLILIGLLLGIGFVWVATRPARVRMVRPFLGGEVPSPDDGRFRVPGTQFYETIRKLPVIGTLLRNGERGAMDLYGWSGRYGHSFVELLRSQHTGLISLYVAWCVLGLTATLVYLLVTAGA